LTHYQLHVKRVDMLITFILIAAFGLAAHLWTRHRERQEAEQRMRRVEELCG